MPSIAIATQWLLVAYRLDSSDISSTTKVQIQWMRQSNSSNSTGSTTDKSINQRQPIGVFVGLHAVWITMRISIDWLQHC
jgi:hypothetical protein